MSRRIRKDGQPYARNYWHEHLMEHYSCAAHAWWLRCEATTSLYPTEVAEFKRDNPHPLLRDFMIHLAAAGGWRRREAA